DLLRAARRLAAREVEGALHRRLPVLGGDLQLEAAGGELLVPLGHDERAVAVRTPHLRASSGRTNPTRSPALALSALAAIVCLPAAFGKSLFFDGWLASNETFPTSVWQFSVKSMNFGSRAIASSTFFFLAASSLPPPTREQHPAPRGAREPQDPLRRDRRRRGRRDAPCVRPQGARGLPRLWLALSRLRRPRLHRVQRAPARRVPLQGARLLPIVPRSPDGPDRI